MGVSTEGVILTLIFYLRESTARDRARAITVFVVFLLGLIKFYPPHPIACV
jgi:hypothetical protein